MPHINVPAFPGNRHHPRGTEAFQVVMPTRVHRIMHEVAQSKQIHVTEMLGMRGHFYRYARREAMRRVRAEIKAGHRQVSYTQIGKWFGCHNVTVMVACGAVEQDRHRLAA